MAKYFKHIFKLAPGAADHHQALFVALGDSKNHVDTITTLLQFIIDDARQAGSRFPKELRPLAFGPKLDGPVPDSHHNYPPNIEFELLPAGEVEPWLRVLDNKCDALLSVFGDTDPDLVQQISKISISSADRRTVRVPAIKASCDKIDDLLAKGLANPKFAATEKLLNGLSEKFNDNPSTTKKKDYFFAYQDDFETIFAETKGKVDMLRILFGQVEAKRVSDTYVKLVWAGLVAKVKTLDAVDKPHSWKAMLAIVRGPAGPGSVSGGDTKAPDGDNKAAVAAFYEVLKDNFDKVMLVKSKGEKVSMVAVINRYAKALRRNKGISTLTEAKDSTFNLSDTLNLLVTQLMDQAWQILSELPLQFAGVSPAGAALESLRLFVPPRWPFRIGAHTPDSRSVDAILTNIVPLAKRPFLFEGLNPAEAGVLFFSGGEDGFYVEDAGAGDQVCTIENDAVVPDRTVYLIDRKIGAAGDLVANPVTWKEMVIKTLNRPDFDLKAIWLPVYVANETGITAMLIRQVGGGGHGIGRADSVRAGDYLWSLPEGKLTEKRLKVAQFLGLDLERFLEKPPVPSTYPLSQSGDNKFYARYIELENEGDIKKFEDLYWVQINLPRPTLSAIVAKASSSGASASTGASNASTTASPSSAPVSASAGVSDKRPLDMSGSRQDIWDLFNIVYYRRVNDDLLVLKDFKTAHNRPLTLAIDSDDVKAVKEVVMNPPIDLDLRENQAAFRTNYKTQDYVLKNKRTQIKPSNALRENAGTVMAAIGPKLLPAFDGAALSAGTFAKLVFEKDRKVLLQWQALKNDSARVTLPTDQEWCHLKGHGDSGKEVVGNFAGGSYHCNTEQLAIEIGHRFVTHKKSAKTGMEYSLNVTAYLFENKTLESPALPAEYGDQGYGDKKGSDRARAEIAKSTMAAPLAAFIRYKIAEKRVIDGSSSGAGSAAGSDGVDVKAMPEAKVFDHLFEAQSEFFDRNMFTITSELVRALLNPDTFFQRLENFQPD